MRIEDILLGNGIIAGLKATSKKQLLQELSSHIAQQPDINSESELDRQLVFETLLERERLGSTGVGRGVAIPHGRVKGLNKIIGVFARLDNAIEYDSVDGEAVDLVFLLLAPENAGADHLKALARVSRLMRSSAFCDKVRGARDHAAISALVYSTENAFAA